MATVYVTRREVFSASHRLFNPAFTDEQNLAVFDKCASPNGHGHNYVLEVTVAGGPGHDTGYVIDLKELKRIIKERIIRHVDHRHLNLDVDFLAGIIPTAENLAIAFWDRLASVLPAGRLVSVRVHETENNMAEYRGEQ
jgi:6-pyruvoyltetrahydropterin/6-carboxytetrahydropterin synthase